MGTVLVADGPGRAGEPAGSPRRQRPPRSSRSVRRPTPRPPAVRTGPGFRARGRRPPAGRLRRTAPPGPLPHGPTHPLDAPHTARPHRSDPIARSRHRQADIALCHLRWLHARGDSTVLVFSRFPAEADRTGTGAVRDVRAAGSNLAPPLSREHQGILRTRKGEGTNMRVTIRNWFRPFWGLDPRSKV